MTEKEAIELLKTTSLMRYEVISGKQSYLGDAIRMAIEALEKQSKAREKAIDEFTEKLCNELTECADTIESEGVSVDVLTLDGAVGVVMEIAERMKAVRNE